MIEGLPPRYAIYFTPDPGSMLAHFGAGVIGYDAYSGSEVTHLAFDPVLAAELTEITQSPRRYGFHATLVAPFYLHDGDEDGLREGVERFGKLTSSALVGRLEVRTIDGYIALMPPEACPAVNGLAAHCVEFFDCYRAPLSADDLRRRSPGELSQRQRRNLDRWGYPYVFDDFQFHMTLTGELAPGDRQRFHTAISEAFRPIADVAHHIDTVSLMRQRDPKSKFEVIARVRLVSCVAEDEGSMTERFRR